MMLGIVVGNRIKLHKQHPCGGDEWVVERVGVDIGLRCAGCGRRVALRREVFLKRLKKIVSIHAAAGEEGE
jgi:hypothetical protein